MHIKRHGSVKIGKAVTVKKDGNSLKIIFPAQIAEMFNERDKTGLKRRFKACTCSDGDWNPIRSIPHREPMQTLPGGCKENRA